MDPSLTNSSTILDRSADCQVAFSLNRSASGLRRSPAPKKKIGVMVLVVYLLQNQRIIFPFIFCVIVLQGFSLPVLLSLSYKDAPKAIQILPPPTWDPQTPAPPPTSRSLRPVASHGSMEQPHCPSQGAIPKMVILPKRGFPSATIELLLSRILTEQKGCYNKRA